MTSSTKADASSDLNLMSITGTGYRDNVSTFPLLFSQPNELALDADSLYPLQQPFSLSHTHNFTSS